LLAPAQLREMKHGVTVPANPMGVQAYGLGLTLMRVSCGTLLYGNTGGLPGYTAWMLSSAGGHRQIAVAATTDELPRIDRAPSTASSRPRSAADGGPPVTRASLGLPRRLPQRGREPVPVHNRHGSLEQPGGDGDLELADRADRAQQRRGEPGRVRSIGDRPRERTAVRWRGTGCPSRLLRAAAPGGPHRFRGGAAREAGRRA
jgi:hypothetical protein